MNQLYIVQEKQIWQDGAAFNDRAEYQVWFGAEMLAAFADEAAAIEEAKRLYDRLIYARNFCRDAGGLFMTWSFKDNMPCLHVQDSRLVFHFGIDETIERLEVRRENNPE